MAEITLHEYIQQIKRLIEEGRYDEVVAHCRHIIEHFPKYLEVYRVLGEAMLEAGQEDQAENMFLRVLSGDPENFVAHAGMSVIYDRRGDLDKALWHMERAFELSPDNPAIRNELRRLYGRKTGVEPGRLDLTQAALARLYARGGHYRRAIEEFRALLEEEPDRVDLQVALAEALWRNEQRIQAEELCLGILERVPFCLKANLILGEIYTRTGREEGKECLAKAEALDPENRVAAALFSDESPLPPREVRIERLEYTPPEEERPSWLPEPTTTEIEAAPETHIEIPAWLEEISTGEEEPAPPVESEELGEGLEVPSWLVEPTMEEPAAEPSVPLEAAEAPEPEVEAPAEAAAPPEPAEIPDWLKEMAPPEVREETPEAEVPPPSLEPAEIPDWLKEITLPEVQEEPPAPEEAEGVPERLTEAIPPAEEGTPSETPAFKKEIPEWLAEALPEEAPPAPEAPSVAEAEPTPETPEWLEGERLPSGDEALAWLESLAKGKEEELRAAAEAEAEARFAEIVGRPRPAEEPTPEAKPEIPEWLEQPTETPPTEEAAPPKVPEWLEAAPPPTEEVEPTEAPAEMAEPGIPDWLAEAAFPEEAPPVEPEVPEVPRGPAPVEEEAFGWTGFEVEEEAPPPPEAPPEEGFGWTEFEAPSAEAPTEPTIGPAPLEEVAPEPPVAPAIEAPSPEKVAPEAPTEPVPEVVEAPPTPPADLEALREHLRAHPRDHEARLTLARALWHAGRYEESLEAYSRLLRANKQIDEVLADLEGYVEERRDDPSLLRTLGDAYMRADRLAEALEVYREALKNL